MTGNRRFMRLTETQLAYQDHKPRHHPRQHAGAIDINKHALRIGNDVVQARTNQQDRDRNGHAGNRYAMARNFPNSGGELAILSTRLDDKPTTSHVHDTNRERRRKDYHNI